MSIYYLQVIILMDNCRDQHIDFINLGIKSRLYLIYRINNYYLLIHCSWNICEQQEIYVNLFYPYNPLNKSSKSLLTPHFQISTLINSLFILIELLLLFGFRELEKGRDVGLVLLLIWEFWDGTVLEVWSALRSGLGRLLRGGEIGLMPVLGLVIASFLKQLKKTIIIMILILFI